MVRASAKFHFSKQRRFTIDIQIDLRRVLAVVSARISFAGLSLELERTSANASSFDPMNLLQCTGTSSTKDQP